MDVADLALTWDPNAAAADLTVRAGDLLLDDGLETAVLLSLFLDARADGEDPPDGTSDRRGWWGDEFYPDSIGSRLWLLSRSKRLSNVRRRLQDLAREALAWMIEDRVAATVDADAEILENGYLLKIDIVRPGASSPDRFRYDLNWDAQLAKAA